MERPRGRVLGSDHVRNPALLVFLTPCRDDVSLSRLAIHRSAVMASLPAGLVTFAQSHVHSVEALQVLLLCIDYRERWWDVSGVADRLSLTKSRARHILDGFARSNLLDIRISDTVRFRFDRGIQELQSIVAGVVLKNRARF
jgi:hypothetical protein